MFLRTIFAASAVLFTAAVVVQFYLAAVGVFSEPEQELFGIHGANGTMVLRTLAVMLVVTAALAKAGKNTMWMSVTVLVLVLFQTVLFILVGVIFGVGPDSVEIPLAATLTVSMHALVGLTVLGLAIMITRRAVRLARTRPGESVAEGAHDGDTALANSTSV